MKKNRWSKNSMRPFLLDLRMDALPQLGQSADLAKEKMAHISKSGLGMKYTPIGAEKELEMETRKTNRAEGRPLRRITS